MSQRIGDTVLVRAGPTDRAAGKGDALYASRAVAYQHGDSTRFRWYWSIAPRGSATAASSEIEGRGIGFCGEIGKGVAIGGIAPHDPTPEDSIAVWSRVP